MVFAGHHHIILSWFEIEFKHALLVLVFGFMADVGPETGLELLSLIIPHLLLIRSLEAYNFLIFNARDVFSFLFAVLVVPFGLSEVEQSLILFFFFVLGVFFFFLFFFFGLFLVDRDTSTL